MSMESREATTTLTIEGFRLTLYSVPVRKIPLLHFIVKIPFRVRSILFEPIGDRFAIRPIHKPGLSIRNPYHRNPNKRCPYESLEAIMHINLEIYRFFTFSTFYQGKMNNDTAHLELPSQQGVTEGEVRIRFALIEPTDLIKIELKETQDVVVKNLEIVVIE